MDAGEENKWKKKKKVKGRWEQEERGGGGEKSPCRAGIRGGLQIPGNPAPKPRPIPARRSGPLGGGVLILRFKWSRWWCRPPSSRPSEGSETPVAAWEPVSYSPIPRWLETQTFLPIFFSRNDKIKESVLAPLPSPSIISSGDFLGNHQLAGWGVP